MSHSITAPNSADQAVVPENGSVGEQAEKLLRQTFRIFQRVTCEYQEGRLILRGRLPSFFLKQIAQETVARLKGVRKIDNLIEVGP